MATYKEVKGVTIQTLDADPVENVGSWSSGGNMNTARYTGTMRGIQTAALYSAGTTGSNVANVENYNGTSWTETTDVNTARRILAGGGTSTAMLIYGGYISDNTGITEFWNGSAWTEVADLNTARRSLAGAGVYTAALAITGLAPPYDRDWET